MIKYGRFFMKQIIKVVLVIIGTIIGAGFASRKRNLSIFWAISKLWYNWYFYIIYPYGNSHLQSI